MAKKNRTYYVCRNCGSMHAKWLGKCPDCQAWNSLDEVAKPTEDVHRPKALTVARGASAQPREHIESPGGPLAIDQIPPLEVPRIAIGVSELDRVLGGGVVPGSAILLGGEPGIGKSTLLLQALAHLAAHGESVLYVTSEESAQQTQLRAKRLGIAGEQHTSLQVFAETNLERISAALGRIKPTLCVIDSIQMIYRPDNPSAPGSVSQLRDCCTELVYLAKATGTAVCLVGHVTKEGLLAGPKLVEHIVDTVLYFEGDSHHDHRIVRCAKNRFGNTLEIGLFRMGSTGLEPVEDSSAMLLELAQDRAGTGTRPAGAVVTAALQGSRVLLVEVQALVADAGLGQPKRKVSGADAARVAMIIAVLEKHAGMRLVDKDIFVNVVGGIKLSEPSADAAIATAIASAHTGRPLNSHTLVLGELGLLGEFRPVSQLVQRLSEAQRLGLREAVIPASRKPTMKLETLTLRLCRGINQAIEQLH